MLFFKGGIILTASHNPGGPDEDFGIKYNNSSGGPAAESVTGEIFKFTESLSEYKIANLPDVNLSELKEHSFDGGFTVDVIDSVAIYEETLRKVFDFESIANFLSRKDFKLTLDALNGGNIILS